MQKTTIFDRIAIALVMVFASHLPASASTVNRDSSYYGRHWVDTEQLCSLEPTYAKEIVVGSPWSANWFATIGGGSSVFFGSPEGCGDMFDRMMPALNVSAGKWFTPAIGARVAYQGFGFKLKDTDMKSRRYNLAHADLLWNVIGADNKDELGLARWTVAPYVGGGIIHNVDNHHKPFAITYGVLAQYRLNRRLAVNMEFGGLNTFRDFDGQGADNKFGDGMYSLTAGLAINIGKIGWKRPVDATPYRQQNEWLKDYINGLLREKNQKHDDNLMARSPNDYSGLASLRARLAHKDWDGRGTAPSKADSVSERMNDGRQLIGVPIYVFFKIGTVELTDPSQLQNIENLAKVAKAYHLNVYVDGAADAATGTEAINEALSIQRASYVAELMKQRGVPAESIHLKAKGGIERFTPVERNRHTRIMLRTD